MANRTIRILFKIVIDTLREYQLNASRIEKYTGVWIGDSKLASFGINVSRWRTMHGLALNVDCNLDGFSRIVPCGIHSDELGGRCLTVGKLEQ